MTKRIKVAELPEFDAAPYLDSDEAIAAYLTDILSANDPALLAWPRQARQVPSSSKPRTRRSGAAIQAISRTRTDICGKLSGIRSGWSKRQAWQFNPPDAARSGRAAW